MARRMAFLALIAIIASVFHSSVAQTTHTVGDTSGWTIGGSVNYSSWAASKSFAVGDILVFNFANNQHDVAQVTKADYDACSTTNPILAATTSPARITINGTGAHYFICRFPGHCSAGQKLLINVSAATTNSTAPAPQPSSSSSSPAPQPTTPVSAPSPSPVSAQSAPSPSPVSTQSPSQSPAPSSSGTTSYTVGDSQGWTLTSNTAQFYQNWASNKTFNVGDVLVFNYPNTVHDVAEVTKANYDACNTGNPISLSTSPPTRITLTAGEHYYICAVSGHCRGGQKLAINVSSSGTAPSPGGSTTPTNPSSPSPAGSTAPPPPDSSARSLSVVGLSATFLSIVVALFY